MLSSRWPTAWSSNDITPSAFAPMLAGHALRPPARTSPGSPPHRQSLLRGVTSDAAKDGRSAVTDVQLGTGARTGDCCGTGLASRLFAFAALARLTLAMVPLGIDPGGAGAAGIRDRRRGERRVRNRCGGGNTGVGPAHGSLRAGCGAAANCGQQRRAARRLGARHHERSA